MVDSKGVRGRRGDTPANLSWDVVLTRRIAECSAVSTYIAWYKCKGYSGMFGEKRNMCIVCREMLRFVAPATEHRD